MTRTLKTHGDPNEVIAVTLHLTRSEIADLVRAIFDREDSDEDIETGLADLWTKVSLGLRAGLLAHATRDA